MRVTSFGGRKTGCKYCALGSVYSVGVTRLGWLGAAAGAVSVRSLVADGVAWGVQCFGGMDSYGYGIENIDELLEQFCGSYDSADFVRLAMAAATEAALEPEQLTRLRAWLEAPVSHTAILQPEAVRLGLGAHDAWVGDPSWGSPGSSIEHALVAVPPGAGLIRFCLAALDQAGMSARGQEHVRALLRGAQA